MQCTSVGCRTTKPRSATPCGPCSMSPREGHTQFLLPHLDNLKGVRPASGLVQQELFGFADFAFVIPQPALVDYINLSAQVFLTAGCCRTSHDAACMQAHIILVHSGKFRLSCCMQAGTTLAWTMRWKSTSTGRRYSEPCMATLLACLGPGRAATPSLPTPGTTTRHLAY